MILPKSFYSRPAVDVAVDLIGKVLVRKVGNAVCSGKIVETEAYAGPHDLACHASKGKTPRTAVMFGRPGFAYVYMIYGIHFCLNAVTEPEGYPAAVLIRAIEPIDGVERMRKNRRRAARDVDIGSGPGKLCQAMSVDLALNAASLGGLALRVEDRNVSPSLIAAGPRIGVDYAGEYRDKPWRFFIAGNPHVSRHKFNSQGTIVARSTSSG
jgi:DNA-3-methyladenine glycosylase